MPKEIAVDPEVLFRSGHLSLRDIPIRSYAVSFEEERRRRGDAVLIAVLRDMMIVREFESMLASFKATGAYRGIAYVYKGPAHLSIGQEGAAVGAALGLEPEDHIFGSHRSHGEFLAKGLSAIARLPADRLDAILDSHAGGALRRTVEAAIGGAGRELAENFLLFGVLAEIFMRSNGFNGGMGGSMHAFFPPFGAYPNNAIVAGSSGIATGAALRRKLAGEAAITVAIAGDGSTGCGLSFEAMNFASMAQYETLWSDARKGRLPVLFFFNNNFYAMGGQTIGETMGFERLARIGAGVNPDQMHAETVDGSDPLAVADAVARKRALLLEGRGPALLDVECYRSTGHSTTDVNAYRTREEMKAWEARDPIARYAGKLVDAGLLPQAAVSAMAEAIARRIEAVTRAAIDPAIAPPVDVVADPTLIGRLMFNAAEAPTAPAPAGPLLKMPEETAAFRTIARKARFGLDETGSVLSGMRAVTLRDALSEAVLHHMLHRADLIAYGEECREWGGAFGVYRGLSEIFPHQRLFNSPISEAAIVSTAVGYALEGGRALVELMYADFLGRAGDEVFNQLAKWQAMSAGQLRMPVVLRTSVGSKYGAQHSQDWTSLITHVPGLRVVYPATPYDAKGLLSSALASDDPTVFFESQRIYDQVELFRASGVPTADYRVPIGVPDIKRAGRDVTVLTIGPSLYPAIRAAEMLSADGVEIEVIDARTLVPFDYEPVLASVRRTGRLVIVTEASERGSFAMTLAANVTRFAFSDLKAPPRVLGAPNWIVPGADMESSFFPQAEDVVDLVMTEFFPARGANRRGHRGWDDIDLARRGL